MNGTSGIKAKPRTLSSVLSDTPAEEDWTKKGLVTAIKNQGIIILLYIYNQEAYI